MDNCQVRKEVKNEVIIFASQNHTQADIIRREYEGRSKKKQRSILNRENGTDVTDKLLKPEIRSQYDSQGGHLSLLYFIFI
jgi:hypothetical protein